MAAIAPIYLDTNAFIVFAEGIGEARDVLASIVAAQPTGASPWFVASELCLAELLVKPLATGRSDLVTLYELWLSPSNWLDLVPVDRKVLRMAAQIRGTHRALKLPDAIHVATCLLRGCGTLISDDRDLREGLPPVTRDQTSPSIVRLDAAALRLLKTELLSP